MIKRKLFEQIASLFLKIKIGLMNNNMNFDTLINSYITKVSEILNARIAKSFLYNELAIEEILKYWMSNYGILLNYGHLFTLIGYLGNDFQVIEQPALPSENSLNIDCDNGCDFLSMLKNQEKISEKQDTKQLQTYLSNEVLSSCVLLTNTKEIINGQLFTKNASQYIQDLQILKSMINEKNVIETLVDDILNTNNQFYHALLNFKKAHNHFVQLKPNFGLTLIEDNEDKYKLFANILEQLHYVLDHASNLFNGFKWNTIPTINTIIEITSVLKNDSDALTLLGQYKKKFVFWDDSYFANGLLEHTFTDTSLYEYIKTIPGINLLYFYTHICYLDQVSLFNYLEQVNYLIPIVFQQTTKKYNIDFDVKNFLVVASQLKERLKETFSQIQTFMHSLSMSSFEFGKIVYSSPYQIEKIMKFIQKK